MDTIAFGEGYVLRSLQSLEAAGRPVQGILENVFGFAALGTLLATALVSIVSPQSIVRPIAGVVSHLRESESTGLLPEFRAKPAAIQEIRDLTESFNRAAAAIREAREICIWRTSSSWVRWPVLWTRATGTRPATAGASVSSPAPSPGRWT